MFFSNLAKKDKKITYNHTKTFERIQAISDNSRNGYIKPWKNHSILNTLEELKRVDPCDLTKGRIFKVVFGLYSMEGVELSTIAHVADVLSEIFM